MLVQVVTASECYRLQLMVGQLFAESAAGSSASAIKRILRIGHVINLKRSFQATFIEGAVVCYERQSVNSGSDFPPYLGKRWSLSRIIEGQSVYLCVPVTVVIGVRTYQPINLVGDFSVLYNDNSHTAYARTFSIGRLKSIAAKFSIKIFLFLKFPDSCTDLSVRFHVVHR